jgi:hypothetical protein
MGTKLPPRELELYRAVDEILWRDWDPIGVAQFGKDARDEYYAYLPETYRLALAGDRAGIAEYLHSVVSSRMGLSRSTVADHLAVADKILEAKVRIEGKSHDA